MDYFFRLLRKGEFKVKYDVDYDSKWTNEEICHHIVTLNCSDVRLNVLPTLPQVKMLFCSNNELTTLPDLPNVWLLDCEKK